MLSPLTVGAVAEAAAILSAPAAAPPFDLGSFAGLRLVYVEETATVFTSSAGEGTTSAPARHEVIVLEDGSAIEFIERGAMVFTMDGGPQESKGLPGGSFEVREVAEADHWLGMAPATSGPEDYLVWYLRELYRLPAIADALANAQRERGRTLPRSMPFAFEGCSGSVDLETAVAGEAALPGAPTGADLLPVSLVRYSGRFHGVVHETRRRNDIREELEPGSFEIALDEGTGLLWSKASRLHYRRVGRPETRSSTMRLTAISRVAPRELDALRRGRERYRAFDRFWGRGELRRAMEVARSPDHGTPFRSVIDDRVTKLEAAAPLLEQQAPDLPWIDVIGVDGATADERVATLRRRYEGRVVLLDFWATWCVPCIESMPHGLDLAHREPAITVVFATYLDERNTPEKVRDFMSRVYRERHGTPFDGIVAMLDDEEAYRRWLRGGIPRYAVIDEDGIVRYQGTGRSSSAAAITVAEALARD